VVNLSAFEVSATQGSGYRTSNSVTGTKSSKRLIDIPASVAVITRDFMDDMISDQTIGDVLKYAVAGAPPSTNRNNFLQIRGQRFESPWTDGIRVSNSPNELSVIDSIEVLKGVNSVLYGTRVPAGGLVNRITKKPQVRSYNAVKLMYGDYDFRRAEIDTTGAIPQTGDRFAYRFIGAKQDYAGYRGRRDQDAYAPMLQYSSGGTTVRHQYIWSETYTPGELPGGIANADGSVFLEGGQRQDYKAPWSFTRKETGVHTTTWLQEIGSWESRVAYMAEAMTRRITVKVPPISWREPLRIAISDRRKAAGSNRCSRIWWEPTRSEPFGSTPALGGRSTERFSTKVVRRSTSRMVRPSAPTVARQGRRPESASSTS
jgi:outer membrane receptor protein involved in Fe transport